jgi:hypothetical protein
MCYGCGPIDMMPRGARAKRRDALESRMGEAYSRLQADLATSLFPVFVGPPLPPDPWRILALRRLRAWWLSVREWIAVHVLRVEVAGDDW